MWPAGCSVTVQVGRQLLGLAEGEDVLDALFGRKAGAHQAGCSAGADDLGMACHVVRMSVGNDGTVGPAGRVERPTDLRQVDAVV